MSKAKIGGHGAEPYRKTIGAHLQHAARLHRALVARKLAMVGLYPGQEQVLKALAAGEVATMGDLAAALRIRPPTASKTIARLSAQGLVERRSTGADGRLVHVGLTDAGRAKAEAIDDIWFAVEDEMIGEFDPKERKRLRKLLRRLEKALGAHGGTIDEDEDEAGEEA